MGAGPIAGEEFRSSELKANLTKGRRVGEASGRDLDVEEMSLILLRMLYSICEFLHKVLLK